MSTETFSLFAIVELFGHQMLLGCPIRVLSISIQRLYQITQADVIREGFHDMNPEEFIAMYCAANKCDRYKQVARIEFEYTIPKPSKN